MNVTVHAAADEPLQARAPTRVLALVTAAAMLILGLLGHALLSAPTAEALTRDEQVFISLLLEDGIGPTAGTTYEDLAFTGHVIAWDLRRGVSFGDAAYALWLDNPGLTRDEAIKVVAAALVVFAPELVPIYTGETGPPADMVA
ncbi:DUF732 domain-containing protein [Mycobacterium sp. SMC-4]|uniref:DUF732 domain-containing protein n=1 Tax=Mycobacterium sp. SMC-4 TaxID=2857059 RepID=UPI003D0410AA